MKEKENNTSSEEFREIFQNAFDSIVILDPDTLRVIQANPSACSLYGFREGELHGKDFSDFFDNSIDKELGCENRENGLLIEDTHITPNGNKVHVEVQSNMINLQGKEALLLVIRNVTEKREAERKALEAREQALEIANNVPGMILQFTLPDPDTVRFLYVNKGKIDTRGDRWSKPYKQEYSREDLKEHVSQEDLNEILHELWVRGKDLRPWSWEGYLKSSTGYVGFIKLNVEPKKTDGKVVWTGVLLDISNRKQNEEDMRLMEMALDSSYDGIMIFDASKNDHPLYYMNPSAEKITGKEREKMIDMPLPEVFSMADQEEVQKMERSLDKKEGYIGEFSWEGIARWVDVSYSIEPVLGEKGEYTDFFVLVMQDITEKKEREKRILDAIVSTQEQERKRVANDLHDGLGQTLNAANLYLKVSEKKLKKGDVKGGVEYVQTTSHLVKNAMTEAREASYDLMPASLKEFGLQGGIKELLEKFVSGETGLHVQMDIELQGMRFDPNIETTIHRIVQEILNNTIKHSGANRFWIHLSWEEGVILLQTFDDGVGFKDPDLYTSEKNGFGLTSLYERVKSLEGSMELDSSSGEGTRYIIRIPASLQDQSDNKEQMDKAEEDPSEGISSQ